MGIDNQSETTSIIPLIAKGGGKTHYLHDRKEIVIGDEYLDTPEVLSMQALRGVSPFVGGASQEDRSMLSVVARSLPDTLTSSAKYFDLQIYPTDEKKSPTSTAVLIVRYDRIQDVISHLYDLAEDRFSRDIGKRAILNDYAAELSGYRANRELVRQSDPDLFERVMRDVGEIWNIQNNIDYKSQSAVGITERIHAHEYQHYKLLALRSGGEIGEIHGTVIDALQSDRFVAWKNALERESQVLGNNKYEDVTLRVNEMLRISNFILSAGESIAMIHEAFGAQDDITPEHYDHRYTLWRIASVLLTYQRLQGRRHHIDAIASGNTLRRNGENDFMEHETGTILLLNAQKIDPVLFAEDTNLIRAITGDQGDDVAAARDGVLEQLEEWMRNPEAVQDRLIAAESIMIELIDRLCERFNAEAASLVEDYPTLSLDEEMASVKWYVTKFYSDSSSAAKSGDVTVVLD